MTELVNEPAKIIALRKRLSSISWFMKFLNEYISKRSNAEDGVTGHFFEGRFKSTRLLDIVGILLCAMYVDLNPIRAGMAKTPETARHTSAFLRIRARLAWDKRVDSQAVAEAACQEPDALAAAIDTCVCLP